VASTPANLCAKSNAHKTRLLSAIRDLSLNFETKLVSLLLILGTCKQRLGARRGRPTNAARAAARMAAIKVAADETAAIHPPSWAQVRKCFFI
jgi:hypothetical protein